MFKAIQKLIQFRCHNSVFDKDITLAGAMIETVGLLRRRLQLLEVQRIHSRQFEAYLGEHLHLETRGSEPEGFAALEVFVGVLRILTGSLIILRNKRQITQ